MKEKHSDSSRRGGYWRFVVPNALVLFCDVSGLLFWLYAALELFVFDFDSLVASWLPPNLAWLSALTFVPVVLWLAVITIFVRSFVLLYIGYVLLFPLILFLWKIPTFLWAVGSWNLGIAVFNYIFSAFTDTTRKILLLAAYVVGFVIILTSEIQALTVAGVVTCILAMTVTYVLATVDAFKTPKVFSFYRKAIGLRPKPYSDDEEEKIYGPRGVRLVNMPEDKVATYRDNLQMRLIASQGSYFIADRLQRFQRSQASVATGILSVISLLAVTLLVFTVVYIGIHKAWPTSMTFSGPPSTFDYVLVAFSNMLFGDLTTVVFTSWQPMAVAMIQRILSAGLVGIFISILINVRSKKYDAELDETVQAMKKNGYDSASSIIEYYGYADIEEAVGDIVQLKAALANLVVRLGGSAAAMSRRNENAGSS